MCCREGLSRAKGRTPYELHWLPRPYECRSICCRFATNECSHMLLLLLLGFCIVNKWVRRGVLRLRWYPDEERAMLVSNWLATSSCTIPHHNPHLSALGMCFLRLSLTAVGLSDQQAVEPASRLLLALMDMYRCVFYSNVCCTAVLYHCCNHLHCFVWSWVVFKRIVSLSDSIYFTQKSLPTRLVPWQSHLNFLAYWNYMILFSFLFLSPFL